MAFLIENCIRTSLTEKMVTLCEPFDCGNEDLNEFFKEDAIAYGRQLMGKTYVFTELANPLKIVCAFTVSNASIFTNYLPNARKKKVGKELPQTKRDLIYPAVLIGRLGVGENYKGMHIGTELMNYIKSWFTDDENKTGCRYLVVDAYNEEIPLNYYQANGFQFMFSTEGQEKEYRKISSESTLKTRMMYFDLIQIANQ